MATNKYPKDPMKNIPLVSKELRGLPLSFFTLKTAWFLSIGMRDAENSRAIYHNLAPDYYLYEEIPDKTAPYYEEYLHQHDAIEIVFVAEGNLTHCIENSIYNCETGYCCILNKWVRHQEHILPGAKFVSINLSDRFLLQLIESNQLFHSGEPVAFITEQLKHMLKEMQFKKSYLEFKPAKADAQLFKNLSDIAEQMMTIAQCSDVSCHFSMMGCLSMLFHYLGQKDLYQFQNVILENSSEEQLFLKVSQILDECHGNISRNQLSEMLHYSGDYINRIIKKHTGKSFLDYAHIFSIEAAKTLLLETDYPIADIMEITGFSNKTLFYQYFREQCHITPNEYRKIYQKKE